MPRDWQKARMVRTGDSFSFDSGEFRDDRSRTAPSPKVTVGAKNQAQSIEQ
jgi:hypothetical protein